MDTEEGKACIMDETFERMKNLAKESLKAEMKAAELHYERQFAYLKPSSVGKICKRIEAVTEAYSKAAKKVPDPEDQGTDIVVSSKKCANDCAAMTKLLQELTGSSELKEKLNDGLTATSIDVKKLKELEMTVREIASSVEKDVKELQERFDRLEVDPANFSFPF